MKIYDYSAYDKVCGHASLREEDHHPALQAGHLCRGRAGEISRRHFVGGTQVPCTFLTLIHIVGVAVITTIFS